MIVQAAPLKRHHQSEKSRQRASLAAIRSRPSIRRRGDIFDELSASPRKTNDGDSSNRRARKIRDDSPPFSAPATERGREREIGFLLSSPRNFNSWTRVQSFPPPLFSVRIRSYRFHAFNIADSPRSCESIPLVFFRACICKGMRYMRVYARGGICRGFGSRDRFSLFWRRASFGISFEPRRGKEPSLI